MFSSENILNTVLLIPGILLAFTFHEYAHAIVAYKLGDKTPKFQGRLTFNPLAHIDPLGFIMILFFKFGWAKPVQVNPSSFKNYYKDDLKVSVAGVVGNLVAALLSTIVLIIVSKIFYPGLSLVEVFGSLSINKNALGYILFMIPFLSININCVLFVLNLIPIPTFDGFHIIRDLFPKFFYKIEDKLYKHQMLILFAFLLPIFGGYALIDFILDGPASFLFMLFIKIVEGIL